MQGIIELQIFLFERPPFIWPLFHFDQLKLALPRSASAPQNCIAKATRHSTTCTRFRLKSLTLGLVACYLKIWAWKSWGRYWSLSQLNACCLQLIFDWPLKVHRCCKNRVYQTHEPKCEQNDPQWIINSCFCQYWSFISGAAGNKGVHICIANIQPLDAAGSARYFISPTSIWKMQDSIIIFVL